MKIRDAIARSGQFWARTRGRPQPETTERAQKLYSGPSPETKEHPIPVGSGLADIPFTGRVITRRDRMAANGGAPNLYERAAMLYRKPK